MDEKRASREAKLVEEALEPEDDSVERLTLRSPSSILRPAAPKGAVIFRVPQQAGSAINGRSLVLVALGASVIAALWLARFRQEVAPALPRARARAAPKLGPADAGLSFGLAGNRGPVDRGDPPRHKRLGTPRLTAPASDPQSIAELQRQLALGELTPAACARELAGSGLGAVEAFIAWLERAELDRREAERGLAVLARFEEGLECEALARLLSLRGPTAEAAARRGEQLVHRRAFVDALLRSIVADPCLTLAKARLAEDSLRRFGVKRGLAVRDAAPKDAPGRSQLSGVVAAVDPRVLAEELKGQLAGGPEERREALRTLQRAGRPILLAELHALLAAEAPPEQHIGVAGCLAAFGQTSSVPPLLARLEGGPTSVRGAAERALIAIVGEAPDEGWSAWWEENAVEWNAHSHLATELLDDQLPLGRRLQILAELDRRRDPATTAAVLRLLGHKDEALRIAAIRAAGALKLARAARAIAPLLDSPITAESDAARWSLQQLSGRDLGPSSGDWASLYPPKKEGP